MKINKSFKIFYLDLKKHPFRLLLGLLAFILIFNYWGALAALFIGTAIIFALMHWDSRVFVAVGLLFLLACPIYLLQRKEMMAEEMAVYAYYSLFLGVMLQILEYWRENKSFKCLTWNKKARKQEFRKHE